MWAAVGKYVGGKTLTALLVVGSGLSFIWFWQHPEHLRALWATMKGVLAWTALVAVLPWATCFVPAKIIKLESNATAGAMLVGYVLVDVAAALWLHGGWFSGALTWTVVLFGFLAAGAYNFVVCDYVAERLDAAA